MVNEADEHAEEDKKRREAVEARNMADSLAYNTEKTLKENEGKVSDEDKKEIEGAIAALRATLEKEDATVEEIRESQSKLETASHKLAQAMYEQAGQAGGGAADSSGGTNGAPRGSAPGDVVDAEFEEVDKDKP